MSDAGAAAGLFKRPGVAGALLVVVLVVAMALRLKGVAWGLPFSFVNADESVVVPKAFGVARGGLNPQFFYYPSFFFYLVGAVYLIAAPVLWALREVNPLAMGTFIVDPGPYFLLARLVSVAAGTASVYLLYRIGREAFGRPSGLVAALLLAVAPLHVAYSHMAVTDVTATALALLAFLLLLQAARGAGRRRLVAGAIAAGLATSTKYNLGALLLPATVAAVYACRGEVARRVAAGGRAALLWPRLLVTRVYAPMLVAFLVASPFVVLDPGHFLHDFVRQNRIMDRGWLGFENVGNGFWYNLATNLGGTLGVVLLVLVLAGLAWALWRHTPADLVLAPYAIAYFVYISTWKELADRYLLPILPLVLLLAARMCVDLVSVRPAVRRWATPVGGARPRRRDRRPARRRDRLRPRTLRDRHARPRQGLDRDQRAGRQHHCDRELQRAAGARERRETLPQRRAGDALLRDPAAPPAGARRAQPQSQPRVAAREERRLRDRQLQGVRPCAGRVGLVS